MLIKKPSIGLFITLLFAHTSTAFASRYFSPIPVTPKYWIEKEGSYSISVDGSYIHSVENYDDQGNIYTPATMNKIESIPARLHGSFGIMPSFTVFAQGSYNYVATSNTIGSNIPNDANYGLHEGQLGARWAFIDVRDTQVMLEASGLFPVYGIPNAGQPPRGEGSVDGTAMLRLSWFPVHWMSFALGGGFTYRTGEYTSHDFPYMGRIDVWMPGLEELRGWAELNGYESARTEYTPHTPERINIIPGGSLLYHGINPRQTIFGGGLGVQFLKNWEISGAYHNSTFGRNVAEEQIYSLGIVYRPDEKLPMTIAKYSPQEVPLDYEIMERNPYRAPRVYTYAQSTVIEKISSKGNFVKIALGGADGIENGQQFHIFVPGDEPSRLAMARARVVAVRPNSAFLRVEEYFGNKQKIYEGFEARRVVRDPLSND